MDYLQLIIQCWIFSLGLDYRYVTHPRVSDLVHGNGEFQSRFAPRDALQSKAAKHPLQPSPRIAELVVVTPSVTYQTCRALLSLVLLPSVLDACLRQTCPARVDLHPPS